MKKLLTILILASCSAFGQSLYRSNGKLMDAVQLVKSDTLKYQLSKHGQYTERGVEYTSLFQEGDIVTTTRLKENFSYRIGIIHWRNKKVLFEYAGIRIDNSELSGLHLQGDLKLK